MKGTQTEIAKTEDAPRPDSSKLQPAMQPSREQLAAVGQQNAGDLTLGNPSETQPPEPPRPRTLQQALAQQNQLPGVTDEAGRRRPARSARAVAGCARQRRSAHMTPPSSQAVTQRWYDLLDSQKFARDRTGKVVLRFHLNYDGSITDMEVVQNTVGDLLGYVCQKAVMDPAPFAKWPTDMRRDGGQDYREITFTFYYY